MFTIIIYFTRRFSFVAGVASLLLVPCSAAYSQSFADRLRSKALDVAQSGDLNFSTLSEKQKLKVFDALLLGKEYGIWAREREKEGYRFAHEQAAYDWGYEVGDPKTVRLVRLYWEGLQLGVFAIGDFQERISSKSAGWRSVEAAVGGNGQEYDVNDDYLDDLFSDVQIAVDGAEAAQRGDEDGFNDYKARF
ncbi:hypothetical protein [Sulfitobacter sp. 1A13679]|uniref:hypothetical protein n=1 Tax=Sulfitobacter sp. 1A13679 TaxID=3368597 RepID=UPI0037459705